MNITSQDKAIIKQYIQAYENSPVQTLFDVYKNPSWEKVQAYKLHEEIAYEIYSAELNNNLLTLLQSKITSFNTFTFTCVTEISPSNKDYKIYIISTPSTIYIHYSTGAIIKLDNSGHLIGSKA